MKNVDPLVAYTSKELKKMRLLERKLENDGYLVHRLGIDGDKRSIAVVSFSSKDDRSKYLDEFMDASKTLLSKSEKIPDNSKITAEDLETLSMARLVIRNVQEMLNVDELRTIGDHSRKELVDMVESKDDE